LAQAKGGVIMLTNKLFNKAFLFALALCLLAGVLVLAGCENETEPQFIDRQFIPAGEWASPYDDYYDIQGRTVHYHTDAYEDNDGEEPDYSTPEKNLKGDIILAVDFSETSGVLIIKVTSESNVSDFAKDKFTGIYYSDYTASSIKLANPWIGIEVVQKDTLNEAIKTFTVDSVGDHVAMWGTYTR
jgi:hypothetical protein